MNDYKGKNSIHSQHLILVTLIVIRKKKRSNESGASEKEKIQTLNQTYFNENLQ